ncbi:MAG: flagellar biosynthesis anti-sigma factor FlgM [Burkholderiales bacterium]|nr:flagellar biosynthesis anti-sigma factor FlgM [Burkholderiales bacterium]
MKIDGNLRSIQSGTVSEGQARTSKSGTPSAQPAASAGPRVQLSPLGSQLAGIEASLADVPVVDSQRVEEIKQAISDGRFKVNPDVIADRLLETVRELIQSQRG